MFGTPPASDLSHSDVVAEWLFRNVDRQLSLSIIADSLGWPESNVRMAVRQLANCGLVEAGCRLGYSKEIVSLRAAAFVGDFADILLPGT